MTGVKSLVFNNYEDLVTFVEADFFSITNKGMPQYLVFSVEVDVKTGAKTHTLLYTLDVDPFFEMLYEKKDTNFFHEIFEYYKSCNASMESRLKESTDPDEVFIRRWVGVVIIRK